VAVPEKKIMTGDFDVNYHLKEEESLGGKVYSAGNYKFKDEEFTGRMVIPPGINSPGTIEGMGFCQKLPAHRREIHLRNGILPGITSSRKLIQTGKIKIGEKSSKW
jgi:hypothetical protein